MRVESFIFDLDGTLVDSLPGIEFSVDAALESRGLPARTRDLREMIGPPIRNILSSVAGPLPEPELTALERAFRASYDAEGWEKTLLHQGARDMLDMIRAGGTPIFIATNKPGTPTGLILRHLGIWPFFREVTTRDSIQPPYSSKTAMLSGLLERHELAKDHCCFVGDSREDYEAGLATGLCTVIISHGYGGSGLPAHAGFVSIDRFAQLPFEF